MGRAVSEDRRALPDGTHHRCELVHVGVEAAPLMPPGGRGVDQTAREARAAQQEHRPVRPVLGDGEQLARVCSATVSAHTSALRRAGLLTPVRAGRAVLHRRTALGSLLVRSPGGLQLTQGGQ